MDSQIHSDACPAVTDALLAAFQEWRIWNPDLKPVDFMHRRWDSAQRREVYVRELNALVGVMPSSSAH